jgi:hypothetical protein
VKDQLAMLEVMVVEQGQQQLALKLALTCIEHALGDEGNGPMNHQFLRRPDPGPEDDANPGDDFLPTAHELEFPKYDGSNNPLQQPQPTKPFSLKQVGVG